MPQYDPKTTEAKWQKKWKESGLYRTNLQDSKKPKYYNLVMFPYPSGDRLHIGHWYNYAPADSWGRYMRMKGYEVFEPMGYDAFGLPAENYAIKTGVHPDESTRNNTENMTKQLERIGTMYDWEKTLNTSTPEYYQWTQQLFLLMYKNGLAYKKAGNVNWCPSCQTVLANEQAQDGNCERCGTEVIQKPLEQWFWKVSDYAQRLLDGLDGLDWPEKTKLMQRNWIGRSEGAEVRFEVEGSDDFVEVFTTRVDTLFGVTYVVLAPEHPLVEKITTVEQKKAVEKYVKSVGKKTELQRTDLAKEKTGVFTGGHVVNPANGEKLPVWIADYALMNYGTGAVMAVPAHDERDHEFAKKFKLPMKQVVVGKDTDEIPYFQYGKNVNSDFLDGLSTQAAKKKMAEWLEKKKAGKSVVTYRLRDWLVSRQRYWGAPIPIVYDPDGNAHPVPEEHLPWTLPTDVEFKPTGKSPLTDSREFLERTEKIFGKGWTPEYDTMDTFVCSSFYYLRYLIAPGGGREGASAAGASGKAGAKSGGTREGESLRAQTFVDPALEKRWMPVDMYIGGPEHACMHLIYARFVMMALKDFGVVSHEEPFKRLVHQGFVTHKGAKMSKSKGNVVSPDEFIEKYGSDIFRMYLMFMGPFTEGGDWDDKGITGTARFAERFYVMVTNSEQSGGGEKKDETFPLTGTNAGGTDNASRERALGFALARTIKKVTEDIERLQFNTSLAALMEFLNDCKKITATAGRSAGMSVEAKKAATRLLAPMAPHLAEELWEFLGEKGSVFDAGWPEYDPKLLVQDTITLAVQVNGKVRAQIQVSADASKEDALAAAQKDPNAAKYLEGKKIHKEIFVPGKLVGFAVGE